MAWHEVFYFRNKNEGSVIQPSLVKNLFVTFIARSDVNDKADSLYLIEFGAKKV